MTGDFDVQVQLTSLTNIQSGTRAGLIYSHRRERSGFADGAGEPTASDGYRFNYRSTANAVGVYQKYGSLPTPTRGCGLSARVMCSPAITAPTA